VWNDNEVHVEKKLFKKKSRTVKSQQVPAIFNGQNIKKRKLPNFEFFG
jgi:hypothetical protein